MRMIKRPAASCAMYTHQYVEGATATPQICTFLHYKRSNDNKSHLYMLRFTTKIASRRAMYSSGLGNINQ